MLAADTRVLTTLPLKLNPVAFKLPPVMLPVTLTVVPVCVVAFTLAPPSMLPPVMLPDTYAVPATLNLSVGVVFPIPTLPVFAILTHSLPLE